MTINHDFGTNWPRQIKLSRVMNGCESGRAESTRGVRRWQHLNAT
jgi:hypothetical protein